MWAFPEQGNLMPHPTVVVNVTYWSLVWLILAGPTCFYLVFCRCLGCCGRGRKASEQKKVDITHYSSSAGDVLKKDQ